MSFKAITRFMTRNALKTLPDGKRVLSLRGFSKSVHYLIPDATKEQELKNQVLWTNIVFLILGITGLLIMMIFTNGNFVTPFFFFWWALSEWMFYVLVKKETLPQIDISRESTYFYDYFTSKVQAGINNIPRDYKIVKYLEVPGSNDIMLLLRYEASLPLVLRCRLHGGIVWRFEVHTSHNDAHLNIIWDSGRLHITNESKLLIKLNAITGAIIES